MRTRPVTQALVVATEDVEYLLHRADEFIKQHPTMQFAFNRDPQSYAAIVCQYVDGAVRLMTKQA